MTAKSLLLIISLLGYLAANAQTDTVYFDKEWNSIQGRSKATYFRLVNKENGRYKVVNYYRSGVPQMIGYFDTSVGGKIIWVKNADKYRTGKFEYYHENGVKSSEGIFEKGNKEGEWHFYNAAGTLIELHHYVKGLRHGELIIYDSKTGLVRTTLMFDSNRIIRDKYSDEPEVAEPKPGFKH